MNFAIYSFTLFILIDNLINSSSEQREVRKWTNI